MVNQLCCGQPLADLSMGTASTVEVLLRLEGGAPKKGKDKKGKKGKDKGDKGDKAPLGEGGEVTVEQLLEQKRFLEEDRDHEREERNYFQLERDKINTFWEISKKELEDRKAECATR